MSNRQKLFEDFPPVSVEEWEALIMCDLKGAPFEKLMWKTTEGFDVKPFYTVEDLNGSSYKDTGLIPFLGKEKVNGNKWEIRQDIHAENPNEANLSALNALKNGATSVGFIIPDETLISKVFLDQLLEGIFIECININFITHNQAEKLIGYLREIVIEKEIDPSGISGSIDIDPLGKLSVEGNLKSSPDVELKKMARLAAETSELFPNLRICGINAHYFHNAGSTIVQELGLSMAIISEYMEAMTSDGLRPEKASATMQLNLAAGSVYFMEIAKFRAVRVLFDRLMTAWIPLKQSPSKCFIHATTSRWNQTVFDPFVNMLRGTSSGMSAVLGAVDSLSITPFDSSFRESSNFSDRIARNTQIILKEEAYLDKVTDAASGSYYIESLTSSIIENSWNLFLQIENEGGYLKALQNGFVQKMISESAQLKAKNIAFGKQVFLGTNKYPNAGEKLPEGFVNKIAFLEIQNESAIIEPLKLYRGAGELEKIRIRTYNSGKNVVVFLLSYGNFNWRKGRAGFATGFFACAGFDIVDNPAYDSVAEGMKAASEASANIIVLCSSDDEYPLIVPEAVEKSGNAELVIAGYPKDSLEQLKSMGIKHFIHVKSNMTEELKKFLELTGIK